MVRAFDKLDLIRKCCLTDFCLIDHEHARPIGNAFLHLLHYTQTMNSAWYLLEIARIVTNWEYVQVHTELYSFPMEDAPRPIPNDVVVVAEILMLLRHPANAALALIENDSRLLVLDHFASKSWLVHELYVLQHLIAVLSHLLIHHTARVDVILHELLRPAELHVLIHKLGHKVAIVHELHQVFLHYRVLIRGLLQASERAVSLPDERPVILVDLIHALTDGHLLEQRVGLPFGLVHRVSMLPRLLRIGQVLREDVDVQIAIVSKLLGSLRPIWSAVRRLMTSCKGRTIGTTTSVTYGPIILLAELVDSRFQILFFIRSKIAGRLSSIGKLDICRSMRLLWPILFITNDVLFPIFEILKRKSLLPRKKIVCNLAVARRARLADIGIEPVVPYVDLGRFRGSWDGLALRYVSHSYWVGLVARILDPDRNFPPRVELLCKLLLRCCLSAVFK